MYVVSGAKIVRNSHCSRRFERPAEKVSQMTSIADDDQTLVLHWNEAVGSWNPIRWDSWSHFRAIMTDFQPLAGVGAGDHSFVICVVDQDRTLHNIIPHRYRVDEGGRITDHEFDDLTADERAFVDRITMQKELPSDEDRPRFDRLRERIWQSHLPSPAAARALINDLPGFPVRDHQRPVWSFLSAFGISPATGGSVALH